MADDRVDVNEEDAQSNNSKLKVFISYSRKDSEIFADELAGGLEFQGGFEVGLDRHSIVEGEDWKNRLGSLIADADTVVFVISPGSAASPICQWEVNEAVRLSKRILPVLWIVPEEHQPVPSQLAALNYTRFDGGRSFIGGLKALAAALNTDLPWLREHTRLLTRALEWERASRVENRMLSGTDVAEAKRWAAQRPKGAPQLTSLHMEYIRASEEAEKARDDALLRQNEERAELLKEAEIAAQERVEALTKAEAALKVTATLQRRQAVVSALAIIFLTAAGWWGYGIFKERMTVRLEANREDIRGQVVSYATARGELAADKAEGHETSPYTTAVSRTLSQRNRNIVDALVDAHKKVAEISAFQQRPFLSTSMNGHIYLGQQPASRKKRAILVSVDDPNLGGQALLSGPKHDVEAIAQSLFAMGFEANEVRRLHNVDRAAIEAEIANAGSELLKVTKLSSGGIEATIQKVGLKFTKDPAPPNTLLFFFFSGHGVEVQGLDYLIPHLKGGRANTPQDIMNDAIIISQLTKEIDETASASIVILDTHFPKLFAENPR